MSFKPHFDLLKSFWSKLGPNITSQGGYLGESNISQF